MFKDAIHNNYFFEMFVEDLPMWGYVGIVEDEDLILGEMVDGGKTYLYTHLHFRLGHDSGRIITASVSTKVRLDWYICNLIAFSIPLSYTVEPCMALIYIH